MESLRGGEVIGVTAMGGAVVCKGDPLGLSILDSCGYNIGEVNGSMKRGVPATSGRCPEGDMVAGSGRTLITPSSLSS